MFGMPRLPRRRPGRQGGSAAPATGGPKPCGPPSRTSPNGWPRRRPWAATTRVGRAAGGQARASASCSPSRPKRPRKPNPASLSGQARANRPRSGRQTVAVRLPACRIGNDPGAPLPPDQRRQLRGCGRRRGLSLRADPNRSGRFQLADGSARWQNRRHSGCRPGSKLSRIAAKVAAAGPRAVPPRSRDTGPPVSDSASTNSSWPCSTRPSNLRRRSKPMRCCSWSRTWPTGTGSSSWPTAQRFWSRPTNVAGRGSRRARVCHGRAENARRPGV